MENLVGVAGYGLIGSAIAGRLRRAGFDVLAYDPDPRKLDQMSADGTLPAGSLKELWERAPTVFIAVFDTSQAEAVILAYPGGNARAAILCSTCDPGALSSLGDTARVRGIRLIEAPISGSSRQLASGDAVMLVGGDETDLARHEGLLRSVAKELYHLGPLGNGNRAKLAINLILGINRAALAEGLVLAEKSGLPLEAFFEAARGSAAYSQVMDIKGAAMIQGDFRPQGRISQSVKDFRLIVEGAHAMGQGLPFGETYLGLVEDCVAADEGDLGNSAIIRAVRRVCPRP